jgi:tripartite-type tricarboxylate transporter receptor subunit TctC
MNSRRLLAWTLCLISLMTWAGVSLAQGWPSKPVRVIVPYPPGTSSDVTMRAIGEKLSQKWGQPVVVENKPGASEIVGILSVVQAQPDGYTIGMATEGGLEVNAFLFSKLPYNPVTDLTPITRLVGGPLVYVVRGDSPHNTIGQLLDAAKKAPGKISYGSSGAGGGIHLSVNWLAVQAGNVQFIHAPYRGANLAVQDVLAGSIQFAASPLSIVMPFITDGKLRAIAATSTARLRTLPNVPTLSELGYMDSDYYYMLALAGPAKLPPAVASKIATDVRAIVRDPEFQAKYTEPFGFTLFTDSPEEFAQFLAIDREKQRARVKAANVQLD